MFPSPADTDPVFVTHPVHAAGERVYVQSLMRGLLQNPDTITFQRGDIRRTVWKTYREKLVPKHETFKALVLDSTPTDIEGTVYVANTCLSNAEEESVNLTNSIPYLVETRLKEARLLCFALT